MKKRNLPISPMAKKKWYRKIPWIAVSGAILIFTSWISQNYFKSNWSAQKARLERSQLVIDIEEARANLWELALTQELNKEKPDEDLLLSTAMQVIETEMLLSAGAEGRLANDAEKYGNILNQRDQLIEQAKSLYQKKDANGLVQLAQRVNVATNYMTPSQTQRFFGLVDDVVARERFWDRIFLFAYIVGSLMLGYEYIKNKLAT